MDDDVVGRRLRRFGLSEKEASTYLTLLQLGEATAGELAEATGTSKGYIYEVMRELADLGMASLHDEMTPTIIRPRPPEETVSEFVSDITAIQDELQRRYTESTRERPEVDIVKSRQTSFKRARELVSRASEEVFISIPGPAFPEVADSLRAAMDRGAAVFLLLMNTTADDDAVLSQARECAHLVRRWEQRGNPFTLAVDDRSSIIGDPHLLHGQHRDGDNGLIVLNSPKVAGSIISLMATFWAEGHEVYVADPPALPATFTSFRAAVVFATRLRQLGRPVDVDVALADGDRLRGRLVGTKQSLLAPTNSDFPLENALHVELDDGRTASVGAERAFLEDYRATEVVLRSPDAE